MIHLSDKAVLCLEKENDVFIYCIRDVIDNEIIGTYDSPKEAEAYYVKNTDRIEAELRKKNYEKTKESKIGGIVTKHPSFGTISFSRVQCSAQHLFGSSIEHNNTIRLVVSEADVDRYLSQDWIGPRKRLIEVEMSYSQFTSAITDMNNGSGTPVTILYRKDKGYMPECPFISKREQFKQEFADHTKQTKNTITELTKQFEFLFNKKSLTKKDKETIRNILMRLEQDNGANMAFLASQWDEQIDKTISEAKGEIEAFWDNKMHTLMANALAESDILSPLKQIMF